MAYFLTTALGRSVPLENWRAIHTDTILKILFDYWIVSGPNLVEARLEVLCSATGLALPDVAEICQALASQGLVDWQDDEPEPMPYTRCWLTANGAAYVQDILGRASIGIG